jgi:hypothetical protein
MIEKSLKKLLTMTVMKEFPEIENIQIVGDDYNNFDDSYIKKYTIFFGITPENIKKVNTEDIRQKIRDYSLYIINSKNEKLGSILLFNPKNF